MPVPSKDDRRRKDNRDGGNMPSVASPFSKKPVEELVMPRKVSGSPPRRSPPPSSTQQVMPVVLIAVIVFSAAMLAIILTRHARGGPGRRDAEPELPFPHDIDAIIEAQLEEALGERAAQMLLEVDGKVDDRIEAKLEAWLKLQDGVLTEIRDEVASKVNRDELEQILKERFDALSRTLDERETNGAPQLTIEEADERIGRAIEEALHGIVTAARVKEIAQEITSEAIASIPTAAPTPPGGLTREEVRSVVESILQDLPKSDGDSSAPAFFDTGALRSEILEEVQRRLDAQSSEAITRAEVESLVRQAVEDVDAVSSEELQSATEKLFTRAQRENEEALTRAESSMREQLDGVLGGDAVMALVEARLSEIEAQAAEARRVVLEEAKAHIDAALNEVPPITDEAMRLVRREINEANSDAAEEIESRTMAAVTQMLEEWKRDKDDETRAAVDALESSLRQEIQEAVLANAGNVGSESESEPMGVASYIDDRVHEHVSNATATITERLEKILYEDGTGLTDWALAASGASVADFTGKWSVSRLVSAANPFSRTKKLPGPDVVLSRGTGVGECWAFPGSEGFVTVKLARPIVPSSITIDHASRSISEYNGSESSAPRYVRVTAGSTPSADEMLLGDFEYILGKDPAQSFPVSERPENSVQYVRFSVSGNHGAPYTCIYRLRVHGDCVHG